MKKVLSGIEATPVNPYEKFFDDAPQAIKDLVDLKDIENLQLEDTNKAFRPPFPYGAERKSQLNWHND